MELEASAMTRVMRRLVPLLVVGYFVAYIDRVNLGVAALTMNKALGFSQTVFGLGAGIFFAGYFLFEVPSNLLLHKFGARRWIARIMLSWGIISGCMALVQGETSFYIVRLLLGIAEAGFFPGVILYVTLWFPAAYRGRVIGLFAIALPLSGIIGNPVSAALLGLDGVAGLAGWQWLFIIEAIPSVILALFVLRFLTDRPQDATWLPPDERAWLIARLARERREQEAVHRHSIVAAMFKPSVLLLSVVYFGTGANGYGLSFFLPQIVKELGLTNLQTGFVSAIPFVFAAAGTIWWGRRSDRTGERHRHAVIAFAVAGAGMIAAAALPNPYLRMIAISFGALGTFATIPVFWSLPTAFLSGAAAAAGIAVINALGNIAGFAAPYAIGYLRDLTGSFSAGLMAIGLSALLSAGIVLLMRHAPSTQAASPRRA